MSIQRFELANGLSILVEEVPEAQAASLAFLFPSGSNRDPEGRAGALAVLEECLFRGAGPLDARGFIDRLDGLGVLRAADGGRDAFFLTAALDPDVFDETMACYAWALAEPRIEAEDCEAARALALASLDRLEDEPAQRALVEIGARHYPLPLHRGPMGERAQITALTHEEIRAEARRRLAPRGAFLAVTGPIPTARVREVLERRLSSWKGDTLESIARTDHAPNPHAGRDHRIEAASAQVQITLAGEWIRPDDPDEPKAGLAIQVLSGGMGARLFTEVREKRGLVYSVWATLSPHRGRCDLIAYAGTMPARAEETRTVLEAEIRRMEGGVTEAEFERAMFGIRSRLAMDSESVGKRALRLLSDLYYRGRPRTFQERESEYLAVTRTSMNEFLAARPIGSFTRLALGPSA